ncbi:hypothetical protein C8F04DRAFT_1263582 [Mycena alexandri]|uniref:Uncharacterized protein n=1 Tax=Mycena alexandri TaxID=1745969 RepID=A0AAD6WZW0_9AGAR|nr:hypothetical protein C8F04DRAFT_1263582 [Mycena alexandri]
MTPVLPVAPTKHFKHQHLYCQPLKTLAGNVSHPYHAFGGIFIIIATNIPVRGQFGLKIIKTPSTLTWNGERNSIASYPSRPTLTHTMDYISPLLLPKPIFIALKIEYKPTGPCGPGNGRGPAYPFAPHSQTRARALPEMSLTVRHPGPLHPPRAPTPDVLETDGIEVPECEPLVHLDGVSDSLDLSLSTSLSTPHHRPPSRPAPFPLTHPTTFEFAVHARRPSGRRRSESRSPASAPPIKARSRGPLTPTSFDL